MYWQRRVFGKLKMLNTWFLSQRKSYWKTKLRVAAKKWYREPGKQKGMKFFECYYQNNRRFQRFQFQRKSIISINRIRSCHHCLKEYLFQFNIFNTEMCDCGKTKETINHILWQCKLFEEFRLHMINDLMTRKIFLLYYSEGILHCSYRKQ
jgi:hypothetical protein